MNMNINGKLSEDILEVIFSKLTFSDFPNCRIVCKAWNHMVLDYASSFSKLCNIPNALLLYTSDIITHPNSRVHLQHTNPKMICFDCDTISSVSTLRFDRHCKRVRVYTFCNGLLYINKVMAIDVWCNGIWNPMTNEFIKIPGAEIAEEKYSFGLGLIPSTKQYKLFRISDVEDDENRVLCSIIEVWRFGISNQWEPLVWKLFEIPVSGTYFDGVIYWYGYDFISDSDSVIFALDVETETFETVAILNLGSHFGTKLQLLNGTICLNVFYHLKVEVWMMRDKHSWIRQFAIDLPGVTLRKFYLIIAFEDEGDMFFLLNNDLFYFDKNGKKIKMKTLFNPYERQIGDMIHIETFHFGPLKKILAGEA